jgi:hypothetical protein
LAPPPCVFATAAEGLERGTGVTVPVVVGGVVVAGVVVPDVVAPEEPAVETAPPPRTPTCEPWLTTWLPTSGTATTEIYTSSFVGSVRCV